VVTERVDGHADTVDERVPDVRGWARTRATDTLAPATR